MVATRVRARILGAHLLPVLSVGASAEFAVAGPCSPGPAVSTRDRWIPGSGLLPGFRTMNKVPAAKAQSATATAAAHDGQGCATLFPCSARRFASTRISSPAGGKTWLYRFSPLSTRLSSIGSLSLSSITSFKQHAQFLAKNLPGPEQSRTHSCLANLQHRRNIRRRHISDRGESDNVPQLVRQGRD